MEQVELPQVNSSATLQDALETMRTSQRSGLITNRDDRRVVITVGEVVERLRENGNYQPRGRAQLLAEIEPGSRIVDLSTEVPSPSIEHPAVRRAVDAAIANLSAEYVVVTVTERSGQVATAFKPLADALRQSFSICICRGDPQHVWLARDVKTPGKCDKDGTQLDCS